MFVEGHFVTPRISIAMSNIHGATVAMTAAGILITCAQWVLILLAVVGYIGNRDTDEAGYATLGALLFIVIAVALEGFKRKVGYALTVTTPAGAVRAAHGSERAMRQMCSELLAGLQVTRSSPAVGSMQRIPDGPPPRIMPPVPADAGPQSTDHDNVQCESCGALTRRGRFCSECGHRLVQAACRQCNTPLGPEARFCTECGAKVG